MICFEWYLSGTVSIIDFGIIQYITVRKQLMWMQCTVDACIASETDLRIE